MEVPKDQLPKIFGMTASPIYAKKSNFLLGIS
jgi:predicted Zn-dependent protease